MEKASIDTKKAALTKWTLHWLYYTPLIVNASSDYEAVAHLSLPTFSTDAHKSAQSLVTPMDLGERMGHAEAQLLRPWQPEQKTLRRHRRPRPLRWVVVAVDRDSQSARVNYIGGSLESLETLAAGCFCR